MTGGGSVLRSPAETRERRIARGTLPGAILILLAGVGFTLPVLYPTPHSGGDNAAYLALAVSLLDRGAYLELWDPLESLHTKYPPVYPLLLTLPIALGATHWLVFKWISAALMIGSALLAHLWISRRLGSGWGIAIGLLLVLAPANLWAASWELSEPLFLFFTLAALLFLDSPDPTPDQGSERMGDRSGNPGEGREEAKGRRIAPRGAGIPAVAGAGFAILALFTRSAGLPLIVAVGGAFLLHRGVRAAMLFLLATGVPAGLWWLRGRGEGGGEGAYTAEFLLVDPYRPELGAARLGDFILRVVENLDAYLLRIVPEGIFGLQGGAAVAGGAFLALLAGAGWVLSIRRRPGVAELFLPLYVGLLLLWPQVWAGDRFALPLFPLLLLFAGVGIRWGLSHVAAAHLANPIARLVLPVLLAILLVSPLRGWNEARSAAADCRTAVERSGPWACQVDSIRQFEEMARWAGSHLPDDAAVFSRNPRLLHLVSGGLQGRTFPLSADPSGFFRAAEEAGIRYLALDRMGRLSADYVVPIIERHPERFCGISEWGGAEWGGFTYLLGIRTDSHPPAAEGDAGVTLHRCPETMLAATPGRDFDYRSSAIPLLLTRPR